MEAKSLVLVVTMIIASFTQASSEKNTILLSNLPITLSVMASPKPQQVLKAGEEKFTVTWSLISTAAAGTDSAYQTVKAKLCYAPISQKQRSWRKTNDDLEKDKTCPHLIVAKPYTAAGNTTVEYPIQKDIPQATYFIRAYAFNADGHPVSYGQTTNTNKTGNLSTIKEVTGRSVALDIASVCFSAFSVLALIGFFVAEKTRAKNKY